MKHELIIQNGCLMLPAGPTFADLRIADGKIADIGAPFNADGARVIDASGKLVFPGFIDTHTHLDMDTGAAHTSDNFAQGTRAALAGGTTTLLDFATQEKGGSLQDALDAWHRLADGVSFCNYGFHMAITDWNDAARAALCAMTAAGVTSYKLYMAYDALRVDDAAALDVVRAVAEQGGIVGMHCEVGDLVNDGIAAQRAAGRLAPSAHPHARPNEVEALAIARWLAVGRAADYPVNIVHLSTREGLALVREARAAGQRVYVETCPQYLALTEAQYNLPGFESAKFVLSPPLRSAADVDALWRGLQDGAVDTIGTDHCAFDFHGAKQNGRDDFSAIPNGMPGVEHRAAVLFTLGVAAGRIDAPCLARVLAEQPAKLFGMYPQKGVLQVGSDADVVIWNPDARWTISASNQHQHVDYTPYEGFAAVGRAETVILNGAVAVEDGAVLPDAGGRYVRRAPPAFWR